MRGDFNSKWPFNHNSNFKMGLLTIIQIPCHYVLANEIALNLKYCIALKKKLI